MNSYKTAGIVLRRVNFGERDRILTILTRDHGKVSAIARGVRRINSRLGSHIELFTLSDLQFARGKKLDVLTGASASQVYSNLSSDYDLMRCGFLFCEMVNRLTGDDTSAEVFDLLTNSLAALNGGMTQVVVELFFKLRLLSELGYKPNLEHCMQSLTEIQAGRRYAFNPEKGGLVALNFAAAHHPEIGQDHIKLWRLLLAYPLDKVADIKGVSHAAVESLPIANDFITYLFGKRFKAEEI